MKIRPVAVSLFLFVGVNLHAQGGARPTASAKSGEIRIVYTEETLQNGLKVIYHVDRTTPVAAVLLWDANGKKIR